MTKLEVRCCCDANKVLGYMAHPKLQKPGDRVLFPMMSNNEVRPVDPDTPPVGIPVRILELTVNEFFEYPVGDFGPGRSRIAIKNRDYPLEWLQAIPGFEVHGGEE